MLPGVATVTLYVWARSLITISKAAPEPIKFTPFAIPTYECTLTAVPATVNVKISPPVSTVSIVIVISFAGVLPPTCVPNTVTVSPPAKPVPWTVNVPSYTAPLVFMFKPAPIPELFVVNVTLV